MKNKLFNPNDFDSIITIKDIAPNFPQLASLDFQNISLEKTINPLNYEIISKDYIDFAYKDLKDYYHFEVDKIV